MHRPVNNHILIKRIRYDGDLIEAKRYPTQHIFSQLYNIEFCKVINPGKSKFKIGDRLFFNRGLSSKVDETHRVIKDFRVLGHYERN